MLTVLIRKDESTEVPRQVEDMAAARALITEGMPVFVLAEDGTKTQVLPEDPAGEEAAAVEDSVPTAKSSAAKKVARKR